MFNTRNKNIMKAANKNNKKVTKVTIKCTFGWTVFTPDTHFFIQTGQKLVDFCNENKFSIKNKSILTTEFRTQLIY